MIDEYYISIYKWNTYLYIYNTTIIYIVKKNVIVDAQTKETI